MPRRDDPYDPRGLIHEAYEIDGIGPPECRSIFLDWAIGLPADADQAKWVAALLEAFRPRHPDHPMTTVLQDALAPVARVGRRGGAKGRRSEGDQNG